jgi:RNA polymerase sigma-70 factor (ECF subfamily)
LEKGLDIGEKDLALQCTKGDRTAMRELYNRYAARLSALCSRYATGAEEGVDLMHDTIGKAFRNMDRFHYRGEGSLYSWLSRMAVNLCIDRLRKEGRLGIPVSEDVLLDIEAPPAEEVKSIPLQDLQAIIASLPDTKRVIFNMFCVDGFSHREIAEKLGIAERTSSSLLARARKSLAQMIHEYMEKQDGRLD